MNNTRKTTQILLSLISVIFIMCLFQPHSNYDKQFLASIIKTPVSVLCSSNIDNLSISNIKLTKKYTKLKIGRDTIQEVIDKHSELGYGVLAITDHDNLTFPWKDSINNDKDITIPKGLNIIAGNKYSKNLHHINGFFLKYIDIFHNEEDALKHIENQGGIPHLNHPSRYDKGVDWYIDLYTKYKSLVGLEVINKTDRYPNDRNLWDDILTEIIELVRTIYCHQQ